MLQREEQIAAVGASSYNVLSTSWLGTVRTSSPHSLQRISACSPRPRTTRQPDREPLRRYSAFGGPSASAFATTEDLFGRESPSRPGFRECFFPRTTANVLAGIL